jgi:DNA-binding transcriptional MocR family regulator
VVGRFSISDQAYDAIKTQLLDGAFQPGERLDAAVLAERYFWSITPVRAALHRLAGERLIEARSNEGFTAPQVSETSLRALYDLSWGLLNQALKLSSAIPAGLETPKTSPERVSVSTLVATERLFAAIGASSNDEYARAIIGANERLRLARRLEPRLIPDLDEELVSLRVLFAQGAIGPLERAITTYHKRRGRLVPTLVALLQRGIRPANH